MKMDEVIGDLCLESLIEFIQTQVFGRDNGNIFICAKMRQGSRFGCWVCSPFSPLKFALNAIRFSHILISYENLKIAARGYCRRIYVVMISSNLRTTTKILERAEGYRRVLRKTT